MKTISIVATLAALCLYSPAEAHLFSRLRVKSVPLAVTVAPAPPEAEAIKVPKLRRLNLRERVKARGKFRQALRKQRVTVE